MANPKKKTKKECIQVLNNLITWLQAKDENIYLKTYLITHNMQPDYLRHIYDRFPDLKSEFQNKVQCLLEEKLIKLGYDKNTTMSIFLLKCNYGYQDKQEQIITHKGDYKFNIGGVDDKN